MKLNAFDRNEGGFVLNAALAISTAVTSIFDDAPAYHICMPSVGRLLAVLVLGASWINAEAINKSAELQLLVSDDGAHFQYSIARPEEVRRAWIEVLDIPTILDSRPVAIQQNGEFDWEWNHSALNDYETTDDALTLALWDPDGETWICEGTVISAHPGGVVSQITLAGRTRFSPEPRLGTTVVRVASGSPSFTFDVMAIDLTPNTVLHIFGEKGAKCADRQVHTQVLDLTHARVTIDGECLWQPGVLSVSPDSNPRSYHTGRGFMSRAARVPR